MKVGRFFPVGIVMQPLTGVMLNPVKINLKLFGSELRSNS
jgi:hypothetical protein